MNLSGKHIVNRYEDSDAEWVDEGLLPSPGKPFPQPRPGSPSPPPPHPDEAEKLPPPSIPSNTGAIAAVGAIGGIMGLVLILLAIYMIILKKRLNKMNGRSASRKDDYSLRVEDVVHLNNIESSGPLYVNTTDLQRLVSMVSANKKGSRPESSADVVTAQFPTTTIEKQMKPKLFPKNTIRSISNQSISIKKQPKIEAPTCAPPSPPFHSKPLSTVVLPSPAQPLSTVVSPSPARPAPPPPVPQNSHLKAADKTFNLTSVSKPVPPPAASKPILQRDITSIVNSSPVSLGPDVLEDTVPSIITNSKPLPYNSNSEPQIKIKKPKLPLTAKPIKSIINTSEFQQQNVINDDRIPLTSQFKVAPQVAPKPFKVPLLPPLRIDLQSPGSFDSGCITPDTGHTDVDMSDTDDVVKPVSVSARRAFLEGKVNVSHIGQRT